MSYRIYGQNDKHHTHSANILKASLNNTSLRENTNRINSQTRQKSESRTGAKMPMISNSLLGSTSKHNLNNSHSRSGMNTSPLRATNYRNATSAKKIQNQNEQERSSKGLRTLNVDTNHDPKNYSVTNLKDLSAQTATHNSNHITRTLNSSYSVTNKNGMSNLTTLAYAQTNKAQDSLAFNRNFSPNKTAASHTKSSSNVNSSMHSYNNNHHHHQMYSNQNHNQHNNSHNDVSKSAQYSTLQKSDKPNSSQSTQHFQRPQILSTVPMLPYFEPTKCSTRKNGVVKAYAANTNQGLVRNYNEDRVAIILNIMKPPNIEYKEEWPVCSFFGVYDGHGGTACADFLRDNLHQFVIRDSHFPKNPVEALKCGFAEAERKFTELAQQGNYEIDRSGSCAIVTLIVGDNLYVANVGDSRAFMSTDRGKHVVPLSRDHKPTDEDEQKRILGNGGKIYQSQIPQGINGYNGQYTKTILGPHRVLPGRLSVSRTFGDIEAKIPKYGGNPKVVVAEPEILTFKIKKDCDYLVLASDGIFDKLTNQEASQQVWETTQYKAPDVHHQSSYGVEAIMKESLMRKTLDNITVVMVALKGFKQATHPKKKAPQPQQENKTPVHQEKPSSSSSQVRKSMTIDSLDKSFDRNRGGIKTTSTMSAKHISSQSRPMFSGNLDHKRDNMRDNYDSHKGNYSMNTQYRYVNNHNHSYSMSRPNLTNSRLYK